MKSQQKKHQISLEFEDLITHARDNNAFGLFITSVKKNVYEIYLQMGNRDLILSENRICTDDVIKILKEKICAVLPKIDSPSSIEVREGPLSIGKNLFEIFTTTVRAEFNNIGLVIRFDYPLTTKEYT